VTGNSVEFSVLFIVFKRNRKDFRRINEKGRGMEETKANSEIKQNPRKFTEHQECIIT
jgi:hypothetical protein